MLSNVNYSYLIVTSNLFIETRGGLFKIFSKMMLGSVGISATIMFTRSSDTSSGNLNRTTSSNINICKFMESGRRFSSIDVPDFSIMSLIGTVTFILVPEGKQ